MQFLNLLVRIVAARPRHLVTQKVSILVKISFLSMRNLLLLRMLLMLLLRRFLQFVCRNPRNWMNSLLHLHPLQISEFL